MFRPLFRPSTGLRTKKSRVKACELLQLGFLRPRCYLAVATGDRGLSGADIGARICVIGGPPDMVVGGVVRSCRDAVAVRAGKSQEACVAVIRTAS